MFLCPAMGAEFFQNFTMHVNQAARPGHFMQRVDILGDGENFAGMLFLQLCKRLMGGVRFDPCSSLAAGVVKLQYPFRVAREGFRRRHVFNAVFGPDAVLVTEGGKPGLCRETCAGQDDNAFI